MNERMDILRKYNLWTKEEIYIFIDEVQLIEEWEKSVNSYSQDYTEEYGFYQRLQLTDAVR